jgi:hypothetical protein
MRRILTVALAALLCAGVMTMVASVWAAAPAQPGANTLTAAEKAAGWRLLFDGATTAGWRGFKKTDMPAGWTIEAGALTRTGAGGDIVTVDQFEDFELVFEWKVAAGGNSGVFYHVTEESTAVWHSAPEYQVLDNAGHADGKKPETAAGSDYALHAPVKDVTRKPGEWNQARIVVKGAHVEHWLNGVMLLDYELWSSDWTERVAKSKFGKYPGFGKAKRGFIAIQDHGDTVSFRNIKIRTL